MTGLRLEERPFYAARLDAAGRPRPWDLTELEAFAAQRGDPFGGRLLAGETPRLALQLEACDAPPLWVGLEPRELEAWAGVLARLWAGYGLEPGECVALFDYGSSPLVLLAAGGYTPYLRRGAGERLGVATVCNDGVASLADRMAEIAARIRPAAWVLRRDVLAPLDDVLRTAGVEPQRICRWVAVSEPDGVPGTRELQPFSEAWGIPLRRIARSDAAFFLAGECLECKAFHVDARAYRLEDLGDEGVAVTSRFARLCPAVRHRLEGARFYPPGCLREPRAPRLRWD